MSAEEAARVQRKMELLRAKSGGAPAPKPTIDAQTGMQMNQQFFENNMRSDYNPEAAAALRSRSFVENAKATLASQEELKKRDKKQKPIRELEVKVLRELAPRLDEVVQMEQDCKRAALEVDIAEEAADTQKGLFATAKVAGEEEAEADKAKLDGYHAKIAEMKGKMEAFAKMM